MIALANPFELQAAAAQVVAERRPASVRSLADVLQMLDEPLPECVSRPAQPEPIDFTVLRRRCLENTNLVNRVLLRLRERFTADLAELEQHLGDANWESAALLAHRLKGAAANAAAEPLRQAAARLEQSARARLRPEVARNFEQLRREWQRVLDATDGTVLALCLP